MALGVGFDNLGELLSALGRSGGTRTGHRGSPFEGPVTLTSSKHVEDAGFVIAEADLDDYSWAWRSPDLFVIETADATCYVPRDQVGEVHDVNLPEQPHARTLSIELVAELTLDITFEYEKDDRGA